MAIYNPLTPTNKGAAPTNKGAAPTNKGAASTNATSRNKGKPQQTNKGAAYKSEVFALA